MKSLTIQANNPSLTTCWIREKYTTVCLFSYVSEQANKMLLFICKVSFDSNTHDCDV